MRNKRPVRVAEPEPAKSKMTRNSGENELALAQDIIKDFKQHDLIAPFLTPVNRREVVNDQIDLGVFDCSAGARLLPDNQEPNGSRNTSGAARWFFDN